jgi:protein gp37
VSDNSAIEWTEATWNPLVGCTKVSPGCDHCYAETLVNRFAGHNSAFPNRFDVVTMRDDRMLTQPLRWARPRRIFVNSLSDLFHADVPTEFIVRVFAVMSLAPQHTFQLLTKRHARMRSYLDSPGFEASVRAHAYDMKYGLGESDPRMDDRNYRTWPLPNVWLGVSVEDQHWADIRIPALLDTPAAVRWISAEPLLGPINLLCGGPDVCAQGGLCGGGLIHGLGWVVVGGESGAGARPMHPQWARDLRDQCTRGGVPFLFKQHGEWRPGAHGSDIIGRPQRVAMVSTAGEVVSIADDHGTRLWPEWALMSRVGKKAAGRELDGRTHDEYPAVVC